MPNQTISWSNHSIKLIDQRKLPATLEYIYCKDLKTLWTAIKNLSVRGAPALGVAAAFGLVLGMKKFRGRDRHAFIKEFDRVAAYIGTSRPTAVNLFNAMEEMKSVFARYPEASVAELQYILEKKAKEIFETDQAVCRRMGDYGAALIQNNANILTVCNAGALATVDYGTALGVMYSAKEKGKNFRVYSCETRPLLQGARLTTWELLREKIDTTLICDNMAATLMKQGKIDLVITGADRIAGNGDTANKIGTYNLAVLARYHQLPFYIVAPLSTFDQKIKSGKDIPIEERSGEEITQMNGQPTAPKNVKVYNPAFDVTDASLITAIITEYGIIRPPFKKNIQKMFRKYNVKNPE